MRAWRTYKKRWKASGWTCEQVNDWSLSVESSRNVVTPNGNIGATVANAANGIVWPAAAFVKFDDVDVCAALCTGWLFESWNWKSKKCRTVQTKWLDKQMRNFKANVQLLWSPRYLVCRPCSMKHFCQWIRGAIVAAMYRPMRRAFAIGSVEYALGLRAFAVPPQLRPPLFAFSLLIDNDAPAPEFLDPIAEPRVPHVRAIINIESITRTFLL